jgi:ABC-type transport system involved in multi-copper enzyme maturation permease subunit
MALVALTRLTLADAVRQPVTWLATTLALVLLVLSYLFGMFNFETQDRLRMVATAGVAVAMLNGLFLAVVGASQSVHDELASRTALTLFAKPLSRGSFLIGKAAGIWLVIVLVSLVIASAHLGVLAYAQYTGFEDDPTRRDFVGHEDLWVPWREVALAHLLGLAHSAVMTCLATVLALRLPLVANILACFALFVASHAAAGMGLMGAVAVPALALFQVDDSIQLPDHPLTLGYLGLTVLYSTLYCAGCLAIGLALFKRQDIA